MKKASKTKSKVVTATATATTTTEDEVVGVEPDVVATAERPGIGGGRKAKGGKIIQAPSLATLPRVREHKPSIILHLKCSMRDIVEHPTVRNMVEPFDDYFHKNDGLGYEVLGGRGNEIDRNEGNVEGDVEGEGEPSSSSSLLSSQKKQAGSIRSERELHKKLKQLEVQLHTNQLAEKKSACFWCTYDFDHPPIHLPKYCLQDVYHVYGCFCSPECGTAFLMNENIDSSTKFERYHLLNHIYAKIYDYNKNIKPAPSPYYMLQKYYGNLTIQEYRSLLRNERLFLIVDKPLTKMLPELHEDNDRFLINNKVIPSSQGSVSESVSMRKQKMQTKKGLFPSS